MFARPFVYAGLGLTLATAAFAATATQSSSATPAVAAPATPSKVLGNQACVKCHANEVKVWEATPHAHTFEELHRRPEAKQIASKLGLTSIKHDGRCVNCHYTQQTDAAGSAHAIAGVSCESCHGAAKDWLDIHHNYGAENITRLTESPAHRASRIASSVSAGMRNPNNVFAVAQSCLRCHTTADEELVNIGGHTPGSLDFEFVAWSQGKVRHNFVRTDGNSNEASSPERVRVMFVAGMIAELEASLRATAVATKKATYGVTAAKRTARTAARLKSVAAKVDAPVLNAIVKVFGSVKLKLNNEAQLTAAANLIAKYGFQFAAENDGSALGSLDAFIPKSDRWK
ncbi:cytochrome c family protein [Planctomycetes bacterium K23_9]|uniref:Perchlorate reductase subunit gamma n=1 Tax=Stieleria marina TaxID=1930275 RepID=A0A517P355_9BACT|nr:Perchlorate reductase subunit gamma precursor [Planctomycetes bacterium K23_9]